MKKTVISCTCDRCGYSFYEDAVTSNEFEIMTREEKENFMNREMLHEINGFEICNKCYSEYKYMFNRFMEGKK